jgi:hypothetical protein
LPSHIRLVLTLANISLTSPVEPAFVGVHHLIDLHLVLPLLQLLLPLRQLIDLLLPLLLLLLGLPLLLRQLIELPLHLLSQ